MALDLRGLVKTECSYFIYTSNCTLFLYAENIFHFLKRMNMKRNGFNHMYIDIFTYV